MPLIQNSRFAKRLLSMEQFFIIFLEHQLILDDAINLRWIFAENLKETTNISKSQTRKIAIVELLVWRNSTCNNAANFRTHSGTTSYFFFEIKEFIVKIKFITLVVARTFWTHAMSPLSILFSQHRDQIQKVTWLKSACCSSDKKVLNLHKTDWNFLRNDAARFFAQKW